VNRKLGMNCDCIRHGQWSHAQTLELMKELGFDNFFIENNGELEQIDEAKQVGDRLGLEFSFIHAPYKGVNELWMEGDGCRSLLDSIFRTADAARDNEVSTIICHVASGWHTPPLCDLGFSRFDEIVDYTGKQGVKVAFENVRKLGDLASIMHRYADVSHVGFCFDSGHEHCYTETVPFIDLYHSRMWCTHLHDNFGRDHNNLEADGDFHFLPFDGNYDFKTMIDRMDKYGYAAPLTLEVFNTTRQAYKEMTPEAFIRTAFDRAKRISLL